MHAPSGSFWTLLGIIPVIIWGLSLPIIRLSVENFGIWWTLALFYSGSLALFPLFAAFRPNVFEPLKSSIVQKRVAYRVVLFTLFFIALFYSTMKVERSQVPAIIFVNYLWPSLN